MESANLHHQHQLHQDQFSGSSSLSTPSFYSGVGNNSWNQNTLLNNAGGNLNLNADGFISNTRPRDSRQTNVHDLVPPSIDTSMIQDLGYSNWVTNTYTNQSAHDLHLAKIKEELSESAISCSSSSPEDYHLPSTSYIIRHGHRGNIHDLNENIFLKNFSSNCQLNELQGGSLYSNNSHQSTTPSFGGLATPSRGNFSQIFPTANISNPNSSFLNSSGMNLQVLDLLTSTKFGGGYDHQLAHNNLGLFKEAPSYGHEHLKEPSHWLTNSHNKVSSTFINGVTETKRSNSSVSEPKASHTASKKPRLESRSSLAPFKVGKVRKEKLGDRIAALQQLVAPFGKTDTASVLMEAIGYIKFLQDQVETLSVPYMKPSRNNTRRSMHEGQGSMEDADEEQTRDLRSRGLCLVPLSCMSYITNDNIGGWPSASEFGGRT
ncbi:Transcription factor bhlh [Thalictrum thalictroides]|uniref:Transcription factor bhlh n=1 Tax=Thalictrum thalictroides TaxID=46969 RepID=A0A7J6X6A3_THATH|nr:Transcription factor bhlh [Thalictrum thalictroides]